MEKSPSSQCPATSSLRHLHVDMCIINIYFHGILMGSYCLHCSAICFKFNNTSYKERHIHLAHSLTLLDGNPHYGYSIIYATIPFLTGIQVISNFLLLHKNATMNICVYIYLNAYVKAFYKARIWKNCHVKEYEHFKKFEKLLRCPSKKLYPYIMNTKVPVSAYLHQQWVLSISFHFC